MNKQQAHNLMTQILEVICADAVRRFDAIAPVRRVVLKVNPARYGEFVCMATLSDEQRFEGRLQQSTRKVVWCSKPNCQCIGVISLKSPVEAGATIDD